VKPYRLTVIAFLASPFALAQMATATSLAPHTALPIVFTQSISADHAHTGDVVVAKTTQTIRLSDGKTIPAGATISGHVVTTMPFRYNKAPYAQQIDAQLSVHFDTLRSGSVTLPLHVALRAMASPIATEDAHSPKSTDLDPLGSTTQVGGDQLIPSQTEVRDRNGDVVAYNRRDGVYAHLIANGSCDAGTQEVSVDIFSASACGLYGFGSVTLADGGEQILLTSTHTSPELWKHSTALLEVLPETAH
jgi:hypothetical protein